MATTTAAPEPMVNGGHRGACGRRFLPPAPAPQRWGFDPADAPDLTMAKAEILRLNQQLFEVRTPAPCPLLRGESTRSLVPAARPRSRWGPLSAWIGRPTVGMLLTVFRPGQPTRGRGREGAIPDATGAVAPYEPPSPPQLTIRAPQSVNRLSLTPDQCSVCAPQPPCHAAMGTPRPPDRFTRPARPRAPPPAHCRRARRQCAVALRSRPRCRRLARWPRVS